LTDPSDLVTAYLLSDAATPIVHPKERLEHIKKAALDHLSAAQLEIRDDSAMRT